MPKIGASDIQQESRATLGRLRLDQKDVEAALTLATQAVGFDVPLYSSEAWLVRGIVLLHGPTEDRATTAASFQQAVEHAQKLIDACVDNFAAHDWRGLGLCGQAVCDSGEAATGLLDEAEAAFRAARQRNSDSGWLKMRLADFDRLFPHATNPATRTRLEALRKLLEPQQDEGSSGSESRSDDST